jgi:hypothetical protein
MSQVSGSTWWWLHHRDSTCHHGHRRNLPNMTFSTNMYIYKFAHCRGKNGLNSLRCFHLLALSFAREQKKIAGSLCQGHVPMSCCMSNIKKAYKKYFECLRLYLDHKFPIQQLVMITMRKYYSNTIDGTILCKPHVIGLKIGQSHKNIWKLAVHFEIYTSGFQVAMTRITGFLVYFTTCVVWKYSVIY